jgi:hypothetical protein
MAHIYQTGTTRCRLQPEKSHDWTILISAGAVLIGLLVAWLAISSSGFSRLNSHAKIAPDTGAVTDAHHRISVAWQSTSNFAPTITP